MDAAQSNPYVFKTRALETLVQIKLIAGMCARLFSERTLIQN
jgi:hypothetical protein